MQFKMNLHKTQNKTHTDDIQYSSVRVSFTKAEKLAKSHLSFVFVLFFNEYFNNTTQKWATHNTVG